MRTDMPKDRTDQLQLFREAVTLLGGQRAAARYLDTNERTVRALCGDPASPNSRELHDGWLRDIGRALLEHAGHCKALERRLSPAFAANLTADQLARQGKPDGRRFDARETAHG
jgi:hypothetical protein